MNEDSEGPRHAEILTPLALATFFPLGVEVRLAEIGSSSSRPSASSNGLLSTDSSPVDGSDPRLEAALPLFITKPSRVESVIFDEGGLLGEAGLLEDRGLLEGPGLLGDTGLLEDPGLVEDTSLLEGPGLLGDTGLLEDTGLLGDVGLLDVPLSSPLEYPALILSAKSVQDGFVGDLKALKLDFWAVLEAQVEVEAIPFALGGFPRPLDFLAHCVIRDRADG